MESVEITKGLYVKRRERSPYWQAQFFYKRLHRTSTKTADLNEAKTFALNWWRDIQSAVDSGYIVARKPNQVRTFGEHVKIWQTDYVELLKREARSRKTYQSHQQIISHPLFTKHFFNVALDKIGQEHWLDYVDALRGDNRATSSVLFHHRNVLRIIIKHAYDNYKPLTNDAYPRIKLPIEASAPKMKDERRAWFSPTEYRRLYHATRQYARSKRDTRWQAAAETLHDYVLFMANTGLRIGESRNLRFCDVEIVRGVAEDGSKRSWLKLTSIKGKRGETAEAATSYWGAKRPFERLCERRFGSKDWQHSTELVFPQNHRALFNKILEQSGLKHATIGRKNIKRDFVSLRHSYITFRLLAGANPFIVAKNCRTSVEIIERHYARHLDDQKTVEDLNRVTLGKSHFGSETDHEDENEDIAQIDPNPPKRKKPVDLQKSAPAIVQLHESGHSVREIARIVGGSSAGVHKILKNNSKK
jgi:integrase